MVTDLILIGGGGHAKACLEVLAALDLFRLTGIVERPGFGEAAVQGVAVVGGDEDLPALIAAGNAALVTVGQIGTPQPRIRLYSKLVELGARLPAVIAPTAHVAADAELGAGTIVMQMAMVGPSARIGANCIINSRALVEHDVQVGDHCHVATGALVNGGCVIGSGSFIGSGAVLKQGVRIGERSLVGMGSIVYRDLPAGAKVIR